MTDRWWAAPEQGVAPFWSRPRRVRQPPRASRPPCVLVVLPCSHRALQSLGTRRYAPLLSRSFHERFR